MNETNLALFDNSSYKPGNIIKICIWFFFNSIFINSYLPIPVILKIWILKIFGTKIGKNVMIKPAVNIKYPWFLEVGDNSWIGEGVWIDNLAQVRIADNVCVSQGAYLLTGNHDYTKADFTFFAKPIALEKGSWVGAKSIVCPGVVLHSHAVLSVGSVATSDCESYGIYQGNPAQFVKKRAIKF
ncbi:MAG: WcaF family extracellular polysaccharide biosynthesis acetyltransferase [Leadbetterella sp.]